MTLVARREERLKSLAAELAEHEVEAAALACDLIDPEERDRLAGEIHGLGRSVEVLVNNAGFGSRGRFIGNDPGRMVDMVRLNVEAVVDLTSRYMPGMGERGRGAIVNALRSRPSSRSRASATYAASKAFVLSFSEALHTEQRGSGVTVTAVCPGPVKTEFTDVAGMAGVENETPTHSGCPPRKSAATRSKEPTRASGWWSPERSTGPSRWLDSTARARSRCR